MMGLLLRIFLIGLVIYFLVGLVFGGYSRIKGVYYWMRPTPVAISCQLNERPGGPHPVAAWLPFVKTSHS